MQKRLKQKRNVLRFSSLIYFFYMEELKKLVKQKELNNIESMREDL